MTGNWDPRISSDRCRGMFAAHFLGDALGGPFEFSWGKLHEYTGKLDTPLEHRSRWQGIKLGPIGQTTDDTAMTLVLLQHLIQNSGEYSEQEVIVEYWRWASGATMVGRNTRDLLRFKAQPRNVPDCFERRWEKKFADSQEREKQRSNGCLMRCAPLALCKSWQDPARTDCFLTNPSEFAWEINRCYLLGLKLLLHGRTGSEVVERLQKKVSDPEIQAVFDQSSRDLKPMKGWILHAFWCFLQACQWGGTLSEFFDWIIRQGGDTDTNACIAGAALGARLGWEEMQTDPVFRENWTILCETDVSKSEIDPRPEYQGFDVHDILPDFK